MKRVSLSLLIACLVPAGLFCSITVLAGVWPAILAALAWSYGAIAWRAATGRRTSGLLILIAIVLTGRTLLALLADSTFLYFLQPIISDGVVATAFLLSLATARPLVARLAGDFYPMDHEPAPAPADPRPPPPPPLFWRLTLLWALLCLGKAGATLWMLLALDVETFVLVRDASLQTLNILAVAGTIALAVRVARKEGLLDLTRSRPDADPSHSRDFSRRVAATSDGSLSGQHAPPYGAHRTVKAATTRRRKRRESDGSRSPGASAQGGGAGHELGGEQHLAVLVGGVGRLVEDQLGGGAAQLLAGLPHGGEGTAAAAAKTMSS